MTTGRKKSYIENYYANHYQTLLRTLVTTEGKQKRSRRTIHPNTVPFLSSKTETEEEEEEHHETENTQSTSTPDTTFETKIPTLEARFEITSPIQIGRGRRKLIGNRNATPGGSNLQMHVENMNEEQLKQALEKKTDDPNKVTIIDNNCNENKNNKKTDLLDTIR